ncbi:hypothetical protein [Streptomyces silaceus]|uniref:hypothetical protein n=1 Tax=Streptomyces silaceus TaxID=545123 RepID=UPI0006EB3369|nr:hypothetical protein [Streptomyces silaceus]
MRVKKTSVGAAATVVTIALGLGACAADQTKDDGVGKEQAASALEDAVGVEEPDTPEKTPSADEKKLIDAAKVVRTKTDSIGSFIVDVELKDPTKKRHDFFAQIEALDANGDRLETLYATFSHVGPGQKVTENTYFSELEWKDREQVKSYRVLSVDAN